MAITRAKGLELWGTALLVEEPCVRQLAAWVRLKAPTEHPGWTGEEEALPAEKRDREPELQLRLGPVTGDSEPPPPEARRAIQIKHHQLKEGDHQVEMDGTQADTMVVIEVPDGYYTDSSDEENAPSAKRAVKKAASKAAAAAPAQAGTTGPPSTKPSVGAGPGGPSTSPQ
ncbi:hypothetical protein LPJ61_006532 [Coemansia biformis]|uniref:Uncharacterized protein n=1 Tax=Coemansia biformis TaxID=1286918 RepID=A0A9W8CNM6_9FUNG|nr:hypothetical protein LPJ61_006532 [Coemansia biformis]